MPDWDRVLIDPSRAGLEQGLREAVAAANYRARLRRLPWPLKGQAKLLATVASESEGWRLWVADGRRVHSRQVCSVLLLTWWSDRLGRKHHRIASRRGAFSPEERRNVLSEGEDRPPLGLIYPENVYLRQLKTGWGLFVVCACGAAGAPEELGWVGRCCGPCHDREEGGEIVPRWGRPLILVGHDKAICGVAFRPDGQELCSGEQSEPKSLLWGLADDASHSRLAPGLGWPFAYSPDGALLALSLYFTVEVLDPARRETVCEIILRTWPVQALAFTPDGKKLAVSVGRSSNGRGGSTTFWDARTGEQRDHLALGRARCMAYSPDGRYFAASLLDQNVTVFDTATWQPCHQLEAGRRPFEFWRVDSLAWSPDGRFLATADDHGNVHLWPMSESAPRPRLLGFTGSLAIVAFAPDGKVLAAAGREGVLSFFSPASGRELAAFRWHGSPITALAFSPDGQWLATGGPDRLIKLWPWPLMVSA
jgi:WD40 repeat protein